MAITNSEAIVTQDMLQACWRVLSTPEGVETDTVQTEVVSSVQGGSHEVAGTRDDEEVAKEMAITCIDNLRRFAQYRTRRQPAFYFCVDNMLHLMAHGYFLENAALLKKAVPLGRIDFDTDANINDEPKPIMQIGRTVLQATTHRYTAQQGDMNRAGLPYGVSYTATRTPIKRVIAQFLGFKLR